MIPESVMEELFQSWSSGQVDRIQETLSQVLLQGYSGLQLLSQIHHEVVEGSRFSKKQKAQLAIELAKVEKCLIDGADEELQMLQLLCCNSIN
jgi:replication factor C subunit 2/4